jgi:circadian clock protein KaiC
VVLGGTGSGKTILALQFLVEGVRQEEEGAIFVSFEEREEDLREAMQGMGWTVGSNGTAPTIHIIDADFLPDTVQSGAFDLNGLLAGLSTLVEQSGARRIVFDAVDVLLDLLKDPSDQRRELSRLFRWVRSHGLTAIMTAKADDTTASNPLPNHAMMLYLSHCVVVLSYDLQDGICSRSIRLLKYRGASHSLNELPMVITPTGVAVFGIRPAAMSYKVFDTRISTGVDRLDTMLGGGFYRGSSILVSGSPGTAKTTLGGVFVDAACKRGENAMFISLDEAPEQIVRNLRSIGLDLQAHIDAGLLLMRGYRAGSIETEEFLMRIGTDLREQDARVLAIDPISALTNRTHFRGRNDAGARLLDECKSRGVTVLFTSLLDDGSYGDESSDASISTIADTWMQVSFKASGGERNRALTIIKSRGMRHSNQVRELIIRNDGLTLADVYTAGGNVLMGTARLEREMEMASAEDARRLEHERRRLVLAQDERRLVQQMRELEAEVEARRAEIQRLENSESYRRTNRTDNLEAVSTMRSADKTEAGRQ